MQQNLSGGTICIVLIRAFKRKRRLSTLAEWSVFLRLWAAYKGTLSPLLAWCTLAGAEAFWCLARCAPGLARTLCALCTRVETAGDRGCNHLTQALTPAEYVEKPQEAAASTSDHPSSKAAPPRLLFLKGQDRDCAFNPGNPEYIACVGIIPEQRTASVSVSFQRTWRDRESQKNYFMYKVIQCAVLLVNIGHF